MSSPFRANETEMKSTPFSSPASIMKSSSKCFVSKSMSPDCLKNVLTFLRNCRHIELKSRNSYIFDLLKGSIFFNFHHDRTLFANNNQRYQHTKCLTPFFIVTSRTSTTCVNIALSCIKMAYPTLIFLLRAAEQPIVDSSPRYSGYSSTLMVLSKPNILSNFKEHLFLFLLVTNR